jgi:hypothetical protein
MSTLDDALSSSSPIFDAPNLLVTWKEVPAGENTGAENLYDLGDVLEGTYEVVQTFDDGLPDPVTMTGGNDASGKLTAVVLGRQGRDWSAWTMPASVSAENSFANTYIGTTLPAGRKIGDYLLMFVTVQDAGANLTQGDLENTAYAWEFLGKQTAGTTAIWAYGKHNYAGISGPEFYSDVSVTNSVYACIPVGAFDPSGVPLRWRVNNQVQSSAAGSATVHTQATIASSAPRTVFIAAWASPGPATWTVNAPDTLVTTYSGATCSIVVGRAGLYNDVQVRSDLKATRSVASAAVAMMTFALEPYERRTMTPVEFWSPFNSDSPLYEFERDTAGVQLMHNTVTADGTQSTTLFTGQMADVEVVGAEQVELTAGSETRITLNRSVNLPTVYGRREGCTVDFLVAWILARGNRFIGPAPGPQVRWWVPCYGSVHAGLDAARGYNYVMYWDTTGGPYGKRYPQIVEGPFHTAMWATHTQNFTQELVFDAVDLYKSAEVFPWVSENYPKSQYLQDLFSFNNAAGRISFWVRGDATYAGTPTNVPAGNRYLVNFSMDVRHPNGTSIGKVSTYIDTDRNLYIQMGNDTNGYQTLFWSGNLQLPTDGNWHFYSVTWSYLDGAMTVMRDGFTASTSQFATEGRNGVTSWYADDAELYRLGGRINTNLRSHLPISDIILESGIEVYNVYADVWPTAVWPSFTAVSRATMSQLEGVFNDTPVNAWDTLADLAQSVMAMYRANEFDGVEFLPPSYWGESAQLVPDFIADTEVNAQDLAVSHDPSKSRNVVTVQFTDTSVGLTISNCLQLTTSTPITPGTTEMTFTLDFPVAEVHGASDPYAAWWTVDNVTAFMVSSGSAPVNKHFMAINAMPDGSGPVYYAANSVTAKILRFTSTTVTLQFINKTGKVMYLANNSSGDIPYPSLRILGYVVKTADAYVTERDAGSISKRRERAMEVEVAWITDRTTAYQLASSMVTVLARPRAEVGVVVQGDPRRYPGQLVTLVDSEGTRASGSWRVLGIAHNGSGAEFTQNLQLIRVPPVGIWDVTDWDDSIWGE